MSGEPWLVARGLTKAYGRHQVLAGFDLEVPAAALTVVVGSNGAGKSTLFGCLAGVVHHAGSVSVDGVPLRSWPGRIAYLPQRVRLPGAATVGEMLSLFRALSGRSPDRVAVPDAFVPAGHRRMAELSGGEAKRVALAGVLLGSPELVLLDEPLADLDDGARGTVRAVLAAHGAAGASILVASPAAAFDLVAGADRVVHMESGRVAFAGTAADFLAARNTTVWVAPGDAALDGEIASVPYVERDGRTGRCVTLECRDA